MNESTFIPKHLYHLVPFACCAQKLLSEFDQRSVGQGGVASGHEPHSRPEGVNVFDLKTYWQIDTRNWVFINN